LSYKYSLLFADGWTVLTGGKVAILVLILTESMLTVVTVVVNFSGIIERLVTDCIEAESCMSASVLIVLIGCACDLRTTLPLLERWMHFSYRPIHLGN
jgi:hypothetical protein